MTDIGLVQETPLYADLARTVERLNRFIPFEGSEISGLAMKIDRLNCELVICDIAPMGIAVGREAGVPSLLVENLTWDWVYQEYMAFAKEAAGEIVYQAKDLITFTCPRCFDYWLLSPFCPSVG